VKHLKRDLEIMRSIDLAVMSKFFYKNDKLREKLFSIISEQSSLSS
jgi:hypothetical protein